MKYGSFMNDWMESIGMTLQVDYKDKRLQIWDKYGKQI